MSTSLSLLNYVPHIDLTVSREDLVTVAVEIVKRVKPELSNREIHVKVFTDGLTNSLVGCFTEEDNNNDINKSKDGILVRRYGEKTELFIDRQVELLIMVELSKANFGPPVYCTFNNGICYGYEPGSVLRPPDLKSLAISKLIATRMAQMHSLEIKGLKKEPLLFPLMWKMFAHCPDFGTLKCHSSTHSLTKEDLRSEIQYLENRVSNSKATSDVVFCHNDLLSMNTIYNQANESIQFIDYEYAGYNFRAFDIANHFVEFCGPDRNYDHFPDFKTQMDWVSNYVQAWNSDDKKIRLNADELWMQSRAFVCASNLLWAVWALVQSRYSAIQFDYKGFAARCMGHYFEIKDNLEE